MKRWMKDQKMSPKCIAIDEHYSNGFDCRLEYIFECEDYVLVQYGGMNPHLSIESHWNGDVLAETDGIYDYSNVECAEKMLEHARGNDIISSDIVEKIIYKLMVGDIKLEKEY